MKFTKYILAGLVLIISVVTVSVLTSVSQIAVMEADGHAVSASATVKQSLIKGEDVIQPMTEVHVDDVIYSNALGYYVGANRTAIDRNYPILINGGETLKFLDESSILVSSGLNLLTTYNGLYLNDGHTYNENLSQADPDEFILLALKNGLYMSTQSTSFTNDLGSTEIPVGSIIRFSDSDVRFYRFEDGFLYYEEIQAVFNGKLTVGVHEYEYETLLKALSIISEKAAKPGKNVEKELEEIANNELTEREKETEETDLPAETEGAGTGDDEIVIPEEQQITEEEVFYLSEVADGERNGNSSGQDDIREVKNENQDIPSVNRDQKGADDEDISDEDRTTEVGGGDIPSTDKHPENYNKKEGHGTGTKGGAGKREYKKPEITMNAFESWAYAVKAHLNYSDPGLEVKSAVVVEVYDIKNPQGIPSEDKQGNKIYSRLLNEVDENDRLWKGSVSDSGDIFMSPFKPGSKVYVRFRYTYYTDITELVTADFCSDFTEIELKDLTASVVAAVKAEWTVERDDSSLYSAFGFRGLTLENTTGYDADKEETFEDFKKNTLPYISTIQITLQNRDDITEEPVVTQIPGGLFGNAKSEPIDYTSTGILKPGTRYSYTVKGLDAYGNEFPLMVETDETKKAVSSEEFVGSLFTWKTVPQVTLRYDKIMQTSVESTVSVIDSEQIFDKTIKLKFCIFDSEDKKVKFSYQLDQEPEKKNVTTAEIPSDPSKEHSLVITGLEKGEFYLVRIYGTYDPSLSGTAAQIVEDGLILSQDLGTARDASDYYIPTVQVEIEKPGKNTLDGSVSFLTDRKADAKKKTVIPSGVVVTVYEGLAENTLKDPEDPKGSLILISDQKKNVYSWKDKVGVHPIERVSSLDVRYGAEDPEYDSQTGKYVRKTEDMTTFGGLLANSTFYLQATYSYYVLEGETQKEIRVYSDLVEMHTEPGELNLDPILLDLTQVFAAGERSISFKHISLDEEVSGTADISALHSLLDSIEMTFTRVGDTEQKNIVLSMSSMLIRDAIESKNASYDSGLVKELEPDSVYTYGVRAYRSNGDELVMKTTAHEEKTGDNTIGKVYTKKTVPSAKIRTSLNAGGDVTLEVYFADKNNALIAGNDLVFSLYEKKTDGTETRVALQGKIDGKNIASVTADTTKVPLLTVEEHKLELTGLTVNQIYRISVEGSYDLTPSAGQFFKNKLPVEFGELVTNDQQSIKMAQRTVPAVTFSNIQEWYYAVGLDITVDDPSAAITKDGITVYVQDESGKQLMKRAVSGTQQFALYPLEPGSKAFIYGQYEYEYYDEAGTKLKKKVTTPKVAAQLLSLPKDGSGIPAIRGNWDEIFAVSSSQAGFEHVKFVNPAVYDADQEGYSFDNFKNNILNYLSSVEVEFTPEGDGDRVKVTIESDTLEWAKLEEEEESTVSVKTKKGLLQSNKKYTYKVTAKDPFGNELPLRMSVGEGKYTPYKEFSGCIYTAKQAPQLTITEDRNEIGDMELLIDVEDSDNSMISELPFEFRVRDGKGKVKLNGVFYTISAKTEDGYEYPVRMSVNSEEEEALVEGPDVWDEDTKEKEKTEENKLPLPEITYREDQNEEEVDELFIHIKDTKLYMNQNRGVTFTFSFENKDGVQVTGTLVPYAIDKANFGPTAVPMNGRNGYKFIINNLELGENYRAEVTGSYDPQPDAKPREEGADLDLVENEILAAKKFVASDGSIAEPGTAIDPGEPEDSEGNSGNVYLLEPRVSMGELKSWAYAVGSSFNVYDPTSSIELGIRVYIATSIKGNQKYTTNINGQKVYSGEKNELVASKRQSFDGTGDFEVILNGNTSLEPGTTYYFQYSYEYYKTEMKLQVENGTRKKKVKYETSAKQKYTSDITEVKALTVEEANLAAILGTWNENPAAYTNTFEFQKLHFGNTANYDPNPKSVSFENFKKNTVNYLKKVRYTLVELDSQEQETQNVITVTSASVVEKAVSTLGGVTFTADTKDLKPNSHYRYRIEAIDDYGNLIPLDVKVGGVTQAVSYKTYRGIVYTKKAAPAIKFVEKAASSGVVNFDITVDDVYQSLVKDTLTLSVVDAATGLVEAKLGGTVNGSAIEEGVTKVALSYRDDGTYHVMINTLDFSTQYCLVVSGKIDPQPDYYPEGVAPLEKEPLDERYQFGTQAMTYGQVYFNASVSDDELKSNSAKINLIMAKDTIAAVLDMISYYEISFTDVKTGTKAATVRLYRDSDTAAGITGLADIPISGAVSEYLVHEEAGLKVYVTGTPRSDDENVWQAIRSKWNSEGEYQTPMVIRTEISGNYLASKTKYEVSVVSMVVRPNGNRKVPTYVVNNTFTTKKKNPELRYSEFYKVSTVAEMTGVYVEDEDITISGAATATLVDMTLNGTKIAVEDVPIASGGKTVTPVDLVFKELVVGHTYLLTFTTDFYNNRVSGGVLESYQIAQFEIKPANDVGGDLNLESLDYDSKTAGKKSLRNISAEEAARRIEAKEDPFTSDTRNYQTDLIELYLDAEGNTIPVPGAITIDTPLPETWTAWNYNYYQVYYFNSSKKEISSNYRQTTYKGGTTFVVPAGAQYVQVRMYSGYSYAEHGIQLGYYESATRITYEDSADTGFVETIRQRVQDTGSVTGYSIDSKTGLYKTNTTSWSALYKIPVSQGESYVIRNSDDGGYNYNYGTVSHFYYYDAKGNLTDTIDTTARSNYMITIPAKVAYMSVDYNGNFTSPWYSVYRIEGAGGSGSTYAADVRVQVNDDYGYLAKKSSATAVIVLEELDSILQPTEGTSRSKEVRRETVTLEQAGESWFYDESWIFDGLQGDKNWQVSLYVQCKVGDDEYVSIPLDVITFQTDAAYELIHNRMELKKVWQNPYGHFLVVNDFECTASTGSMYLYGTIDFQGHVITAKQNDPLFETIYPGGVLKNIVYSYPANTHETRRNNRAMVVNNYGTMDNVIIRTEGEFWKYPENYSYGFLCYYNYGLVSNFIFEMGGNFHMERVEEKSSPYANIFMYCNYGIIENFYMFGKNNAKLYVGVQEPEDGATNYDLTCSLIRWQHGIIRNGYTQFDTVIYTPNITGTTNGWLFCNDAYSDNISNYYHVGDFTEIDKNGKSSMARKDRILYSTTAGTISNVWHLTKVAYKENTARILYASSGNLQNLDWQKGVLNDAFDIEESLHVGYYPRLKLNDCMKKWQAYNPLPSKAISSEPEYLSASILNYTGQTATSRPDDWDYSSGLVRLYFNNPLGTSIETLSIEKLTVEKIQAQNMNYTTGQYEVDVKVSVDENKSDNAYKSKYTIGSFEYGNGVKVDVLAESDGFSFWKRVATPEDWYNITNHMDWNYRLTENLDFDGLTYSSGQVQVRKGTDKFTGSIDGGGHTVANIDLIGVDYPCLIYRLSGGTVKNITFNNLNITSVTYPSDNYTGVVGYAERSVIDNVHVKNSTYNATGYVGAVAGYLDTYCSLYNCSSVNNSMSDFKTDKNTFYGGIVGGAYQSVIISSYSRDISITMQECTNIGGAGGIIGRCQGTTLQDGYATGTISGNAYNVGGIVGNFIETQYTHYESLWSRVTIDVTGDYVGGFAGRTSGTGTGILSLGNIFCIGTHVHRSIGYSRYSAMKVTLTALNTQNVPGLTSANKDDCKYLLSQEDLTNWSVWADKVRLDENWDLKECWDEDAKCYQPLEYFPKVYKYPAEYDETTGKRVLVGDQAENSIYLPGKGGEQLLSISSGVFYKKGSQASPQYDAYVAQAEVSHPSSVQGGYDLMKFYQAVKDGRVYRDESFTEKVSAEDVINIIGMDMTGKDGAVVDVNITRDKQESPDTSTILIENKGDISNPTNPVYPFSMAKDNYRLSVNYWLPDSDDASVQAAREALLGGTGKICIKDWKPANLIADITYTDDASKLQKISYWEVGSYNKWVELIKQKNHGKTQENFLITAKIDFAGRFGTDDRSEDELFRNLQFGRLEGDAADCSHGLTNVVYETNEVGDPWIASVTYSMKNLLLENITGNLINSGMTKDRDRNAVIFATRDITNCYFHNIRTNVTNRTRTSSGFILLCYGEMAGNRIEGVYYDSSRVTSEYNYAAGFVCWPQGNITNNTSSRINVQAPLANYVGGLFVSVNDSKMASQSPISEVLVSGNHFYGGSVAVNNNQTAETDDDIPARDDSYVRGQKYTGFVSSYIYENATENVIGRKEDTFTVDSKIGAGGFAYQIRGYVLEATSDPGVRDNTVMNGSVISTDQFDGYTGGMAGYIYMAGQNVRGNTVNGMYVNGNVYTGGMFGSGEHAYFYRNTVVNSNVYSGRELNHNTINSLGTGGMFGRYTSALHVRGTVIRNTKVTGPRNVGGVVGIEANYSNSESYEISYSYVAEDVTVSATDPDTGNAGGLIGYSEKAYARYNAVGASVYSAGNNAGGIVGKLNQVEGSFTLFQYSYFVGSVTGRDYVGGIIGYNRNYVPYTVKEDGKQVTRYAVARFRTTGTSSYSNRKDRSTMNGITVAGTFTATGTTEDMDHPGEQRQHVSAWFNNQTDTASVGGDDARLQIWDQCVLNGKKIDTSEKKPLPQSKWISSGGFREKNNFTDVMAGNLGTKYFTYSEDLQVLKTYMPYVQYHEDDTQREGNVLPYAKYKVVGDTPETSVRGGIMLPDYGTNPDALTVYASGASTVNVEVSTHQDPEADPTPDHHLPDEYQEVLYITNDGKSYINTGYDGHDSDLMVDCKFSNVPSNAGYLFGQEQISSYTHNGLYNYNSLEYGYRGLSYTASGTVEMTQRKIDDKNVSITINNNVHYVAIPENKSTKEMLVFAYWNNSKALAMTKTGVRCHYFTLKKGDEIIRDLVPCYHKSDNVVGMYDLKTGEFLVNANTKGAFTAGPNIGSSYVPGGESAASEVYVLFGDVDKTKQTQGGTVYALTDGVASISYDFQTNISVSLDDETANYTTYTPSELKRGIALNDRQDSSNKHIGDIWYYVGKDSGGNANLHYGLMTEGTTPEYSLPEGYVHVEYIEASSAIKSQYIKTGVTGSQKVWYKILFSDQKSERQLMGIYGSQDGYWGNNKGKYEGGGTTSSAEISDEPVEVIWDYTIGGVHRLSVDDAAVVQKNATTNTTGETKENQIFALSGSYLCSAKLYECKIWKDGTLVRWFVPVIKQVKDGGGTVTDTIPGLFDLLAPEDGKQFYENSYSTAVDKRFTAGPETEIPCAKTSVSGEISSDVTGLDGEPIHIWSEAALNGRSELHVLVDGNDGKVHEKTVTPMGAASEISFYVDDVGEVTSGTAETVKPFLKQRVTVTDEQTKAQVTYDVSNFYTYHALTAGGTTTKAEGRLYSDGLIRYNVSPWQNLLYDQVVVDDRGVAGDYIAVLSGDGTLTASFVCADLKTANVREISNSFTSYDPYIAVLYRDGSLKVADYETGEVIFTARNNAGFANYVSDVIGSITESVSGGSSGGSSSGAGGNGSGTPALLSHTKLTGRGLTVTTEVIPSGSTELSGTPEGETDGEDKEIEVENGKYEERKGEDPETADAGTPGDDLNESGDRGSSGETGNNSGGSSGSGQEGSAEADGTVEGNGDDAGNDDSSGKSGESGNGENADAPAASAVYVTGEGVKDLKGNTIAEESRVKYVTGEGVYVDGKLEYEESIFAGDKNAAQNAAGKKENGEEEQDGDPEEKEKKESDGDDPEGEKEKKENSASEEKKNGNADEKGGAGQSGTHVSGENTGSEKKDEKDDKKPAEADGSTEKENSVPAGIDGEGEADGEGGASMDAAGSEGTPVLLVTSEEKQKQISAVFGENTKIMNTVTGEPEEYDTESVLQGRKMTVKEKKAREANQKEQEEKAKLLAAEELPEEEAEGTAPVKSDSKFVAAGSMNRVLDKEEGSGMLLILFTGMIAVLVFGGVYLTVIRKKREKLSLSGRTKETGNHGEEDNR